MPPGKEGKITLAIEHTESYAGDVTKSATVSTNDPVFQSFTLSLRAFFKMEAKPGQPLNPAAAEAMRIAAGRRVGPYSVAPAERWTTAALRGSSVSGVLYLTNRETKPIRITKVVPGGQDFAVALKTVEEGRRYDLTVATNPALKPGQYTQTVRLLTDNKANPEIPVYLEVKVYPLVFVTPDQINLSGVSFGSDFTRLTLPTIYVRKVREEGLQLKSVTSTLPFLKLDVQTETEGRVYNIRMSLDKSKITGPGQFQGTIRVETNDPETPVAVVQVTGSFTE